MYIYSKNKGTILCMCAGGKHGSIGLSQLAPPSGVVKLIKNSLRFSEKTGEKWWPDSKEGLNQPSEGGVCTPRVRQLSLWGACDEKCDDSVIITQPHFFTYTIKMFR